jgi:ABC-type sugar transport system substrate-binding protein
MRHLAWLTAAGLLLAPAAGFAAEPAKTSGCSGHGTNIDFYDTPQQAANAAAKAEKLVFVLHVSGHFEDPRFT